MPPATRYTPDRILEAALCLTRGEGVAALSARSLAAALGCSTGPLFRHFSCMEELQERLMDLVIAGFVDAVGRPLHDDPLVSVALGWLQYAASERRLYEALFLRDHPWHGKWGPVRRALADRMAAHPRYQHLGNRERFALVGRASIVTHGLAIEVWSGRLPDTSDRALRVLVEQLVVPAIDAALANGWTTDLHTTRFSTLPRDPNGPRETP